MTLLDEAQWSGKIFVGGRWTETSGGRHDVVEPATGATLGVLGTPTAEDVATAAESAAAAQQSLGGDAVSATGGGAAPGRGALVAVRR